MYVFRMCCVCVCVCMCMCVCGCVCVCMWLCVCVLRQSLVNALVIVNVWAFQSGFLFLSRFYCRCTRFCVVVSFLRVNVWSFLCAYQNKFTTYPMTQVLPQCLLAWSIRGNCCTRIYSIVLYKPSTTSE